jgi:Fe2+ transport system protein FeoA
MFKENNISFMNTTEETSLNKLRRGKSAIVERFNNSKENSLNKLLAMGIVPGRILQVVQTYPVFILQIDQTQVAMDKELAEEIIIRDIE